MNKDELDPIPGNLKHHKVDPEWADRGKFLTDAKWVSVYGPPSEQRWRLLCDENQALRAENERLRTLLEQTTVIKREE